MKQKMKFHTALHCEVKMNWKYLSIMGETAFCLHASEFGVYSTLNVLER